MSGRSSGTRTSLINSRHGNLNFRRLSISGSCRNYISGRISTSGITPELRCVWPVDHGSCRFYAISLARTCQYGCRISFSGRPHRSALAWQAAATWHYLTMWFPWSSTRNSLLTWHRIDTISYENHDFTASKVRGKFYLQNVGNWPKHGNYSFH